MQLGGTRLIILSHALNELIKLHYPQQRPPLFRSDIWPFPIAKIYLLNMRCLLWKTVNMHHPFNICLSISARPRWNCYPRRHYRSTLTFHWFFLWIQVNLIVSSGKELSSCRPKSKKVALLVSHNTTCEQSEYWVFWPQRTWTQVISAAVANNKHTRALGKSGQQILTGPMWRRKTVTTSRRKTTI